MEGEEPGAPVEGEFVLLGQACAPRWRRRGARSFRNPRPVEYGEAEGRIRRGAHCKHTGHSIGTQWG